MKNRWLQMLAALQQGKNRKWLLSAFYCVLLSTSYLTEAFNPATKRLFCTSFGGVVSDQIEQPAFTNNHDAPTN